MRARGHGVIAACISQPLSDSQSPLVSFLELLQQLPWPLGFVCWSLPLVSGAPQDCLSSSDPGPLTQTHTEQQRAVHEVCTFEYWFGDFPSSGERQSVVIWDRSKVLVHRNPARFSWSSRIREMSLSPKPSSIP